MCTYYNKVSCLNLKRMTSDASTCQLAFFVLNRNAINVDHDCSIWSLCGRWFCLRNKQMPHVESKLAAQGVHANALFPFAPCQPMERFHSRDQRPYWFNKTKESICIKIEFNSQRVSLVHQYGRRSFVLEHQHGRRDVM